MNVASFAIIISDDGTWTAYASLLNGSPVVFQIDEETKARLRVKFEEAE